MANNTQSEARAVASQSEVERLAREMADMRAEHRTELEALRAENAANRAALAAVQAQVIGQHASPEPDTALGQRRPSPKRRLGRRRPSGSGGPGEASGLVSRRRLFGLLGGAAAVGTGLAVAGSTLTADPAAASGTMMYDASNVGTATTDLTSSTTSYALTVEATGTNGSGIRGGGSGNGVVGETSGGNCLMATVPALQPAGAHLFLTPASNTGAPTAGAHVVGQFWMDSNGKLFQCVVSNTPGTWVSLTSGALIPVSPPHRVYDSRVGQPHLGGTSAQGPLTFTNPPPSAATIEINCAKDSTTGSTVVPSNATALLMNLTVIPVSGTGALAVYANGASQPSTSSINWFAGAVVLANGVTSACDTSQNVQVAIVASAGASTNFALDVIGYYP